MATLALNGFTLAQGPVVRHPEGVDDPSPMGTSIGRGEDGILARRVLFHNSDGITIINHPPNDLKLWVGFQPSKMGGL